MRKWPLILFLYGTAQREGDISRAKTAGPARLIDQGHQLPFIVASPQCPDQQSWDTGALLALLDHLQSTLPVDPDRVCVTGFEMGGYATWYLAAAAPARFAAIVPISGFPKNEDRASVDWLKGFGVWAIHGTMEQSARVEPMKEMIEKFWAAGGHARRTIFRESHHQSWSRPYENPELYRWLARQRRRSSLRTTWTDAPPEAGQTAAGRLHTTVDRNCEVAPVELDYTLYLPRDYAAGDTLFPLLLFLHETAAEEDGPVSPSSSGPPGQPAILTQSGELPLIVAAPRCPGGSNWDTAVLFMLRDHLASQFQIDPERVCLGGIGNGAKAAWRMAVEEPDRFAAIVSVGYVPEGDLRHQVSRLKNLAVWSFIQEGNAGQDAAYLETMKEILGSQVSPPKLTMIPQDTPDWKEKPWSDPELYDWLTNQRLVHDEPMVAPWMEEARNVFPPPASVLELLESKVFLPKDHAGHETAPIRYSLFRPDPLEPAKTYPLIVWLHGHGAEELRLDRGELKFMDLVFRSPGNPRQYPFFLLAMQCPSGSPWFFSGRTLDSNSARSDREEPIAVLKELIDQLIECEPIDASRISLVGISSGGTACWEMAARYPTFFAAAAPMGSLGGDPARAGKLTDLSIWAFHSTFDNHPIDGVRHMVAAVRSAGGQAKLTEIPVGNHFCWYDAFEDHGLLEWLLEHRRSPFLIRHGWLIGGGTVAAVCLIAGWPHLRRRFGRPRQAGATENLTGEECGP